MNIKFFLSALFIFVSLQSFSQKSIVQGTIKDENGNPISGVAISYDQEGITSDSRGKYYIELAPNKETVVTFSHISYIQTSKTFLLEPREVVRFSPTLKLNTEQLDEIEVENREKEVKGITSVDLEKVKLSDIPGANGGVENVIMTFAGVSNNNELSTQYNVRGGNFDENLVYVNGIEVYRPFLVRSGQQEGLSFVNPAMTQNVDFSAGGFESKYGDKLSSVLDITYRTPQRFGAAIDLSLLGGSATIEGRSKNDKFTGLIGMRYRDNSLLLNNTDVSGNYEPIFADIQTFLSYQFSEKFKLDFLGSFSRNQYNFEPTTRVTNFGSIADPLTLIVNYEGQEKDNYLTGFGALNGSYKVNDDLQLDLTTSLYNTRESEHYDILSSYELKTSDDNLANTTTEGINYSEGIGSQLDHARNDLDALIANIQLKANYRLNENFFEFGVKYQHEDIRDRLKEWEVLDSLGHIVRPPGSPGNDEPYTPYTSEIILYNNVSAINFVKIDRISGFAQWSRKSYLGNHELWYNIGVRAQNWTVSGETVAKSSNQTVISPRAQVSLKPDWDKDMLFRFATGFYYQPPFYRELRDSTGTVQADVKAQKSIHFILGHDYSFKMWDRPFKLVTEAYYKHMTDVNPYTVENVRVRYAAKNNAVAYAAGLDMRLNGEFVPGTESWISLGLMKTEENIDDRGYIARPTDQRFKFGLLFQDYVPTMPDLKMYLNFVYNTGLPGGSPSYADPYDYQFRLNAYTRTDLGISYVFVDANKRRDSGLLKPFKELTLGFEIYNMFDVRNSITNTWIRDVNTKQSYAIPNFMTNRVFNLKMNMKF